MANVVQIKGVKAVIRSIKRATEKRKRAAERGVVKAGLFLQRESQKIVPIDTGALKNSAFTRKDRVFGELQVTVGYTQSYAIYVHEDLTARHKPGKTAKYLEIPARRFQSRIRQIIRDEARK